MGRTVPSPGALTGVKSPCAQSLGPWTSSGWLLPCAMLEGGTESVTRHTFTERLRRARLGAGGRGSVRRAGRQAGEECVPQTSPACTPILGEMTKFLRAQKRLPDVPDLMFLVCMHPTSCHRIVSVTSTEERSIPTSFAVQQIQSPDSDSPGEIQHLSA